VVAGILALSAVWLGRVYGQGSACADIVAGCVDDGVSSGLCCQNFLQKTCDFEAYHPSSHPLAKYRTRAHNCVNPLLSCNPTSDICPS
jgi:hypothetical protein